MAFPVLSKDAEPIVVVPSRKLTTPDGIPGIAVTVAVRITACPKLLGLGVDDSVVAVGLLFTVSETGADVEAEKPLSPEYVAEMLWTPADNALIERTAFPVLSSVFVPIVADPSEKITVPVAIAALVPDGATVTAKVTD